MDTASDRTGAWLRQDTSLSRLCLYRLLPTPALHDFTTRTEDLKLKQDWLYLIPQYFHYL